MNKQTFIIGAVNEDEFKDINTLLIFLGYEPDRNYDEKIRKGMLTSEEREARLRRLMESDLVVEAEIVGSISAVELEIAHSLSKKVLDSDGLKGAVIEKVIKNTRKVITSSIPLQMPKQEICSVCPFVDNCSTDYPVETCRLAMARKILSEEEKDAELKACINGMLDSKSWNRDNNPDPGYPNVFFIDDAFPGPDRPVVNVDISIGGRRNSRGDQTGEHGSGCNDSASGSREPRYSWDVPGCGCSSEPDGQSKISE